jgi:hypothetical protein
MLSKEKNSLFEKAPVKPDVIEDVLEVVQADAAPLREDFLEEEPSLKPPVVVGAAPVVVPVDPILGKVERALEDGLGEIYKQLPPESQQEFRMVGEKTAHDLTALIRSAKFSIKKVLKLIFAWLKIIPGINQLFLKQEAKIRADRVLRISDEEKS